MSGKKKTKYNWSKYNKELVNRGRKLANQIRSVKTEVLEFWDEELNQMNNGKEGRRFQYPDSQIVFFSIIRSAFNMNSYRNLEGIGILFFDKFPDYTRMNRRIRKLDLDIIKKINSTIIKSRTKNRVMEISMDGTGVQINGKYVWIDKKTRKVRQRDWKKINIVIDIKTRQIIGIKVLDKNEHEGSHKNTVSLMGEVFRNINKSSRIEKVYADGGYDNNNNFELFNELGIEPIIRIRKPTCNKVKRREKTNKFLLAHGKTCARNNLRDSYAKEQIDWKQFVRKRGYGKRSGIEGVIGSFKRFFREKLFSRINDMIEREILIRVLIWNIMV